MSGWSTPRHNRPFNPANYRVCGVFSLTFGRKNRPSKLTGSETGKTFLPVVFLFQSMGDLTMPKNQYLEEDEVIDLEPYYGRHEDDLIQSRIKDLEDIVDRLDHRVKHLLLWTAQFDRFMAGLGQPK